MASKFLNLSSIPNLEDPSAFAFKSFKTIEEQEEWTRQNQLDFDRVQKDPRIIVNEKHTLTFDCYDGHPPVSIHIGKISGKKIVRFSPTNPDLPPIETETLAGMIWEIESTFLQGGLMLRGYRYRDSAPIKLQGWNSALSSLSGESQ